MFRNRLKQHYLPEGEYQKLWKVVDKHVHKFHALPFERLSEINGKFHHAILDGNPGNLRPGNRGTAQEPSDK